MYRLHNEDCIKGAKKYIKNETIDLIITDPPYGISGDKLDKHYHRDEKNVIDGYEEIPEEEYPEFSKRWIKEAERVLRPGGSIYIFSGYSNLFHILNALRQTTFTEKNHIIWKYNFGVFTSKKFVSSHYHILFYTKPGGKLTFNTYGRYGPGEKDYQGGSLNYQDREDVWVINRDYKPGQIKNKNELPMELLIKIMQYSSNEGDLVADFFLGGFSAAKAAIGLDRRFIGFEINKKSYDYHLPEMTHLEPGYLLSSIKRGRDDRPQKQGKPWAREDLLRLKYRYEEIYNRLKNKKQTIDLLQKEFERGYFSILNQIEKIQRSGEQQKLKL